MTVTSISFSRAVIGCGTSTGNRPLPPSSPRATYLSPVQTITVNSVNGCFLQITSQSDKRVSLVCAGVMPVATPTPTLTATATATATVTPTATATSTPTATPTSNANALGVSNQIVSFNTETSPAALPPLAVTGLNAGDVLAAIDRRPQNGMLYGLGYNASNGTVQLYLISSKSGVATPVGTTGMFVDGVGANVLIGINAFTRIGMDFNPAADRIRVVTSDGSTGDGQNFRINPNTGAFIDGDMGGAAGSVPGVNMDGTISGATRTVQEAAYTNNSPNSTATTLYTLDAATDKLFIQNPPNSGVQTSALSLGQDIISVRGFDIPAGFNVTTSNTPASGPGFAVLEFASNSQQLLSQINLATGTIFKTSIIGANNMSLVSLALQAPFGVPMIGLSSTGTALLRFNAATPATVTNVAVTGVTAGETLVGLDFRPSTGEAMSLGVNPVTDRATLYRVDPQTGAATAIGTPSSIAFITAQGATVDLPALTAGYGVNFNPTVDIVRVVTGSGLNFRVSPVTGLPVDGDATSAGINPDGNVNPGTSTVQGTSYTNSYAQLAGQLVTTQYTIDATSGSIFIQTPPNSGTQTGILPVRVGGTSLTFASVLGFEIPSEVRAAASNTAVTSGSAYAALTVGGVTGLYSINLATGVTTSLGTIATGTTALSGLAVAQSSVD